MKIDTILTVASWEERFLLGIKISLEKNPNVKTILVYYISEYLEWSIDNIKELEKFSSLNSISIKKIELSFSNPIENWLKLRDTICALPKTSEILVDFTTMPRSIIWYMLFFLYNNNYKIHFVYHKAGSYNKEWLSRNPERPRLLYKMSGIAYLGRPTMLFVFTGYDPERVDHLIAHFEPKNVILLVQDSNEYENEKYLKIYSKKFKTRENYIIEGFNSFDIEATNSKLKDMLLQYVDSHNIVITSLGPKTSAISIFDYIVRNDNVGLCYVPAKEFNRDYSKGIGEEIEGLLLVEK